MFLRPFGNKSTLSAKSRLSSETVRPRERTLGRQSRTSLDSRLSTPPLDNNSLDTTAYNSTDAAASVEHGQLFGEDFGQTIYVEKDTDELNNIVSASNLHEVELVPDSPSIGLVKTPQPTPRRKSNKSIISEIIAITLPALGTLLADPLMSLVDTACVGRVSSVQLAALGPNSAIFNMTSTVLSFIAAALANKMARNSLKVPGLSKQEIDRRREHNEQMLSHTIIFATGVGVAVTAILIANGPSLLNLLGTSVESITPALHYLYIRAIAAPAVLFASVAQGACLGQQDMWTPMSVMIVAGLVNFMGDMFLIKGLSLGTAGAAAATAASQFAAAFYFFWYLLKGANGGKGIKLKWKGLPGKSSLKPILDMGRVLLAKNVVIALAYNAMTFVATGMGIQVVAAHQVMLQLFTFAATATDALSLAAQSILARDAQNQTRVRLVSASLMQFAAVTGLGVSAIFASLLLFCPNCFTTDLAVIAAIRQVIPHGMFSLVLYSMIVTFEGICVGVGQLEHLPRMILSSTSLCLGALWAAQRFNLGLTGIWTSGCLFFVMRLLLHVAHLTKNWNIMPFKIPTPKPSYQLLLAAH